MKKNTYTKTTLPKAIAFLLLVLFVQNSTAQNYPMSDQSNEGDWTLNSWLSDEFNGTTLDKKKWWILGENGDYRNKWKGRAPAQFAPHNVTVKDGNLILSSKWEPNYNFIAGKQDGVNYGGTATAADNSHPITQACIMSEGFFKYGYMEIRCKLADAPVTSSFWTTGYHSEIDMVENYGKRPIGNPKNRAADLEQRYRTNLISWDPDKPADQKPWKSESVMTPRLASDFFVYGFEWDKDYIKIFFNGKLIKSATRAELEPKDQWKYQYPQELWIDSEVFEWYGLPTQADLATPAEYKIDYVRIWQKELTSPYFNALGAEGPFHFQGRSLPWWSSSNSHWRLKDNKAASGDFSLRFQKDGAVTGNHSIFSPYGSIDLPAGDNEVTFKIWIDPNTTVNKMELILNNPRVNIPVDLTGVQKGQWIEITKPFTRTKASNNSLTEGDRLQLTISSGDISSDDILFYIDDITFKNHNFVTAVQTINKGELSVYPNPATDRITVHSPRNGIVHIYNNQGMLVKTVQKNSSAQRIAVSDLSTGIYFARLSTKNNISTQKFIIQ